MNVVLTSRWLPDVSLLFLGLYQLYFVFVSAAHAEAMSNIMILLKQDG